MSEMVFRPRRGRSKVTLNVTSLIDVLFLLLIFFMVTGTFKRAGEMELRLPESSTAAPVSEGAATHQGELVLREDGSVTLDDQVVPLAELPQRLADLRSRDEEARILLKAEAGARHGDVVRLLDLVREAGFPGVAIGTQIRSFQDDQR